MTNVESANRSLLRRVQDLLRRKPNLYDVEFCVGPTKKKVRAVRILLEAASPALEKKFDFWEDANVRQGSGRGVPVPDFDHQAFEIFVKITMLDDWTVDTLQNLKLQLGQTLNLIAICREYEMKNALGILEEMMKSFYNEFAAFKNSSEFLGLSYENLQTILSSDNLPMNELDVFECACRWAKNECAKRKIETSPDNLRLVMGDLVYEIRFPLMTAKEFTQCVKQHDILTSDEGYNVFKFISNDSAQKLNTNVSQLPFKITPRAAPVQSKLETEEKPQISILSLTMDSAIVDSPAFVCDGSRNWNCIAVKEKIQVHGVGFLGPVNADASYDVTVQIVRWEAGKSFDMKKIEKHILAKKGKAFQIMFDQPIALGECSMDEWRNFFTIDYHLKGPNTQSFQRTFSWKGMFSKSNEGHDFRLEWYSNQLAEILYSNSNH